MTSLTLRSADDPAQILSRTSARAAIAAALAAHGAFYDHWALESEPREERDLLAAYEPLIHGLKSLRDYAAADVARMAPDNPDNDRLRAVFLREHVHHDDEVRLFAAGAGVFFIHLDQVVAEIACEKGDLLVVPKGVKHWFDAGLRPDFTAIRIFSEAPRWEADYTGDDIAERFDRALVRAASV